jgi:uncharacterized membrane protein HdeD (DUF308 family)
VEVFHGHAEIFADAVEAQVHIALCEAHGEVHIGSLAIDDPFIHAEEVAVLEVQVHGIDHLGNDGELFGGTDGTANAAGAFGSRLHPCGDVFQRFCRIEFLNGVINIVLGVLLFCFARDVQNIVWVLIGLALLLFGLFHLVILYLARKMFQISPWSFLIPALVAALGLVLVFRPSFLGNTLGLIAGISLVLYGFSELFSTLRMRKVMQEYAAENQPDDNQSSQGLTGNLTSSNADIDAEDVDFEKVDEQ